MIAQGATQPKDIPFAKFAEKVDQVVGKEEPETVLEAALESLKTWLKLETVEELPDKEAERIIDGLLHVGEKLGISAGSKSFKTWLLLYLGFCIANGLDFLGFKTKRSKVVFFDLELSRNAIRRRLYRIRKTVGQGDFTNLKVCSLRGKARRFHTNLSLVKDLVVEEEFQVVIIDPIYKFLLGKDENSNGVVADILEELTVFCTEANVALIYVHHHSKGNQAGKDSLDRSSGAGAWSRDPDNVLDLTKQKNWTKEEQIFTAEITVRDFRPIEKFVVRWDFPLLVRDTAGLDPEELKQPKSGAGRLKENNVELILAVVRSADQDGGITAKRISEATLVNPRTVQRRIKELIPKTLVKAALLKRGYQLSLVERERLEKFKAAQNNKDEEEET